MSADPLLEVFLAGYDCGYEDAVNGRRRPLSKTELGLDNVVDIDTRARRDRNGAIEREA